MVVRDEFGTGDVVADGFGGFGEVFLFALEFDCLFAGFLGNELGEIGYGCYEVGEELPAGGLEDEDGYYFGDLTCQY